MKNPSLKNDPDTFPAENQEEEVVYDYSHELQRKIVAMLMSQGEELVRHGDIIKPEYFTNPVLGSMVKLLVDFFHKYSRSPSVVEMEEEITLFLDKNNKRFDPMEFMSVFGEVIDEIERGDFDYVKDKVVDFARYRATQQAILDSAVLLKKKRDYEGIMQRMAKATGVRPEGAEDDRELDSICAADVIEEEMEWFWHNTFPKAKLSLLAGKPEVGKSFFTMMMAARVSSGASFPTQFHRPVDRGQVLILQTEDGMADTCKKRLRWEGADQSMIHFITGTKDRQGKTYPVDLSTDLEQVRQKMSELGNVKLIIVDPLSAYLGTSAKMDSHKEREVRLALGPLVAFIEQERVAVVGIMHMNKNQMADAIFRISGSTAWAQVPRVIWMIAQDRDDKTLRQFLAMKNNTIPEIEKREAEFGFHIQENHIMVAKDEQPIALAEAVGAEAPEDARDRRGKLKTAIAFLEELKAGEGAREVPVREVKQAFPEINDNTWKQARRKLGISTEQRSDGWWWLF